MTDLFTGNGNEQNTNEPASYLEALVGEGKKYKDPESLAKGAAFKDNHILRIEDENKRKDSEIEALRKEIKDRTAMEELLARIEKSSKSVLNTPIDNGSNLANTNGIQEAQASSNNGTKSLTLEQVNALVQESLSKSKQQELQAQNFEMVRQELIKSWGNDYVRTLTSKISQAGLTQEQANELAKQAPGAFLMMVRGNASNGTPSVTPPQNSGSPTSGSLMDGTAIRNKKYYDNMRKTDPKRWNSAATQVQRHSDAIALGNKFFE